MTAVGWVFFGLIMLAYLMLLWLFGEAAFGSWLCETSRRLLRRDRRDLSQRIADRLAHEPLPRRVPGGSHPTCDLCRLPERDVYERFAEIVEHYIPEETS